MAEPDDEGGVERGLAFPATYETPSVVDLGRVVEVTNGSLEGSNDVNGHGYS